MALTVPRKVGEHAELFASIPGQGARAAAEWDWVRFRDAAGADGKVSWLQLHGAVTESSGEQWLLQPSRPLTFLTVLRYHVPGWITVKPMDLGISLVPPDKHEDGLARSFVVSLRDSAQLSAALAVRS